MPAEMFLHVTYQDVLHHWFDRLNPYSFMDEGHFQRKRCLHVHVQRPIIQGWYSMTYVHAMYYKGSTSYTGSAKSQHSQLCSLHVMWNHYAINKVIHSSLLCSLILFGYLLEITFTFMVRCSASTLTSFPQKNERHLRTFIFKAVKIPGYHYIVKKAGKGVEIRLLSPFCVLTHSHFPFWV